MGTGAMVSGDVGNDGVDGAVGAVGVGLDPQATSNVKSSRAVQDLTMDDFMVAADITAAVRKSLALERSRVEATGSLKTRQTTHNCRSLNGP
jgi:hypothetical protein